MQLTNRAIGELILGAVLLIIAAFVVITMADETARWVGGAILAVLGIASLASGIIRTVNASR